MSGKNLTLLEEIKIDYTKKAYPKVVEKSLFLLKNNQSNKKVYHYLGQAYMQLKNWKAAIEIGTELQQKYPDFIGGVVLLADTYGRQGDYESAIPLWQQVISKKPMILAYQLHLAQCYHHTKQSEQMLSVLNNLLSKKLPKQIAIGVLDLFIRSNYPDVAIQHIHKIPKDNPQHFHLQARIKKQEKDWAAAAGCIGKAYALNPAKLPWKIEQIDCLAKAGQKEQALDLIEQVLVDTRLNQQRLRKLINILFNLEAFDNIETLVEQLDTTHFKYFEVKARLSMNSNDWETAISHWEQAIALQKNKVIFRHYGNLMNCYRQLNNKLKMEALAKGLLSNEQLNDAQFRTLSHWLIRSELLHLAIESINKIQDTIIRESTQVQLLFEQQNYEQASVLITQIEHHKDIPEAIQKDLLAKRLHLLAIQEDFTAIIKLATKGKEEFPDFWPLYARLLHAYMLTNQQKAYNELIELAYTIFKDQHLGIIVQYSNYLELQGKRQAALDLLEDTYKRQPSILPHLLKRYIREGKFDAFLEKANSSNLSIINRLDILKDLIAIHVRKGNYELIPMLVEQVVAIEATDYHTERLLNLIYLELIQLYNLLISPKMDITLVLTTNQKQELIAFLEEKLSILNSNDLINKWMNNPFIKTSDIKEKVKRLVDTYFDYLRQQPTPCYTQTYENPTDAYAVAEYLKKRINQNIPTSLIRLGDGEGNFLRYATFLQEHQEEDQKAIQYIWWKEARLFAGEHQATIDLFEEAVIEADALGITPEQRVWVFTPLGQILNAGQFNHASRGTLGVMESAIHLPLKASLFTSCKLHVDLEMWDAYQYILGDLEAISIISCHETIDTYITQRFGIPKVTVYPIPSELRYEQLFGYASTIAHFPTVYEQLLETLPKVSKGQVFLVAAGFLGKIYCHIIKKHGGIAIDIGSVADRWMGYGTRANEVLGYAKQGIRYTALVGNTLELPKQALTETNYHYTRQLSSNRPISDKIPCQFLITGHPRTGTYYTSKLFHHLGYPIGHEVMGEYGLCSWLHAAKDLNTPRMNSQVGQYVTTRYSLDVQYFLLLVRHPKAAIPSIILENRHSLSYSFRRYHIYLASGVDVDRFETYLERAVVTYLEWIKLIEKQSPDFILRLEYLEEDLTQFFKENSINYNPNRLPYISEDKNTTVNKHGVQKPILTKQDYEDLPVDIMEDLLAFCKRYGYELSIN